MNPLFQQSQPLDPNVKAASDAFLSAVLVASNGDTATMLSNMAQAAAYLERVGRVEQAKLRADEASYAKANGLLDGVAVTFKEYRLAIAAKNLNSK